jgi:hypothetical protein
MSTIDSASPARQHPRQPERDLGKDHDQDDGDHLQQHGRPMALA